MSFSSSKRHLSFLVVALLCGACDQGVLPEQNDVVWFTALETDTVKSHPYEDQRTALTAAQLAQLEPIVNDFLRNHERLFQDQEVTRQISRIEDVFMALGRFHELIPLYRGDVEKRGTASFVAPQLAWAYIRLGQRELARDVLDGLLRDRGDEALIQFLEGAFWIQSEPRGEDAVRKAIAAWKRTLELDPEFRGPEGLDANVLRQEIARFEAQTGPVSATSPAVTAIRRASDVLGATIASAAAPGTASPPPPAEDDAASSPPTHPGSAMPPPTTPPVDDSPPPATEPSFAVDEQVRLLVARAEMKLSAGQNAEAIQLFEQAKALKPSSFAAEFGHQRARWTESSARNDVAAKMRALAQRDDLAPRERYDLGIFLWTKMERGDLARNLWETIPEDDPALAERVGLEALLERVE